MTPATTPSVLSCVKPGRRRPRLMLIFNPEPQALPFTLSNGPWHLLLDSSAELLSPSPADTQAVPRGDQAALGSGPASGLSTPMALPPGRP